MKKIYLAIVLLASLAFVPQAAFAADGDTPTPTDTGVSLNKYVTSNTDGTYTITLEAFAKGASITTITETHVPTDIVLVLDVSGSMDYQLTSGARTELASKGYSYNDIPHVGGTNEGSLYYKYGDNYYKVTRGTNGNGASRSYNLSYTRNGTTYYLSGTGTTTTRPTNVNNANTVIWTGVLYGNTRMAALKSAVSQFVDVIAADATRYNVDHKISVVKFAYENYYSSESSLTEGNHFSGDDYNYTEVVKNLTDVSVATNANSIKSAVNDLRATGGTAAECGLKKAQYIFSMVRGSSNPSYTPGTTENPRQKVVVLFTDGQPTHGSNFDGGVATDAVKNAKVLKDNGATVYSVGVFNNPSDDTKRYMNAVSSNHPSATAYTDGGTNIHDKFMNATNAEELSNIFKAIAEESSSGGSTKTLDSETTTVVDVLTADFTLPADANINNIGLYVEEVTGYNSTTKVYSFGNRTNLVPTGGRRSDYVSIANATTSGGDATKKIVVTGFDFTKQDTPANGTDPIKYGNWVGPRETTEGGVTTTVYKGKRLVITIPIEPAPDYQGGYDLPTNDKDGSGLFSGDDKIDEFPVPEVDFPTIGIIKNGLKKGESATFSILRIKDAEGHAVTGGSPFMIVLTGDGTTTPAYAIIKNIPEGTYRVAESKWSWTYDVTEVSVVDSEGESTITPGDEEASVTTQVLAKSKTEAWPDSIDETVKCVLFKFTNAKKSGDDGTIYAEAIVTNEFKGGTNTSTGNETVNSKTQPTNE